MGTHFQGESRDMQVLDTWIKLTRARETVSHGIQGSVRDSGLTMPQFGVLEILLHLGPQTQKALTHKLLVSGGNVTKVVDNLEKMGLVERRTHPQDRRLTNVHLQPEGKELICSVFPVHLKNLSQAFERLSSTEQIELARLCKKLGTGK